MPASVSRVTLGASGSSMLSPLFRQLCIWFLHAFRVILGPDMELLESFEDSLPVGMVGDFAKVESEHLYCVSVASAKNNHRFVIGNLISALTID